MQIQPKILKSLVARVSPVVSSDVWRGNHLAVLHVFASEGGALLLLGTDGHRAHRATRGDVRAMLDGLHVWSRDGVVPEGWGYFPIAHRDLAAFKNALDTDRPGYLESQVFQQTEGYSHDDVAGPPIAVVVRTDSGGLSGTLPHHTRFLMNALDARVNANRTIPTNHDKRAEVPVSRLEEWASSAKPDPDKNKIHVVRIYGVPFAPTTGQKGWALGTEGGIAPLLVAVHQPYLADAVKACKRRGAPVEVSVQIAGDRDAVVLQTGGDPYLEPASDSTETFTAVVMPIRV